MKFDKNDISTQLGVFALGVLFMSLGYYIHKYVDNVSIIFLKGLKDGAAVGTQIVGVFLFVYGLINVIRIVKKK